MESEPVVIGRIADKHGGRVPQCGVGEASRTRPLRCLWCAIRAPRIAGEDQRIEAAAVFADGRPGQHDVTDEYAILLGDKFQFGDVAPLRSLRTNPVRAVGVSRSGMPF